MTASPRRIDVPRWYAVLSSPRAELPDVDPAVASVRHGPLMIVRPGEGVDVVPFGASASPGVVLFDGYLFDRRALRLELGLESDASDARIAAAAFERWQDEVFDRLDGSFLLAVWSPADARLLLGHDALGRHPVYFSATPAAVCFGSNVLALAGSGLVSRRPNRVSLALNTLMQWPAAGETFFADIRRLDAGRFMTIARDLTAREQEYFTPWLRDDEPELTESEVREQFEPALIAAVSRCMELNPDGIMLSGGLDSVTIAALAAEHSARTGSPLITAVSGRSDHNFVGEDVLQSATATALGMRHVVAYEEQWMDGRNDIERSLDIVPELPGPSRIYWVGGYTAFYRYVAAQSVQVLLTGSGGDNWVSVGNAYAAETLRRLRLAELRRFVRSYTGTGGLSLSGAADALLWSGGARVLLDAWGARLAPRIKASYHRRRAYEALPAWLCPDPVLKDALVETRLAQRPAALTERGRIPRNFYRHDQRAIRNPYYVYEFETGFHVESACGLRLLSPYHDRRLVRLLNAIPPVFLLTGGKYKGLLRPLAESRLPGLGLTEQRKVYTASAIAASHWSLRKGVADLWRTRPLATLEQLGVVDPKVARTELDTAVVNLALSMTAIMSADRWAAVHTVL